MFQIKCADCNCLSSECKVSKSGKACPNCTWEECCCYVTIENGRDIRANDMPILEFEWTETPLSKFGSKCVMNKHDFCVDPLCECLCHHVNASKNSKY